MFSLPDKTVSGSGDRPARDPATISPQTTQRRYTRTNSEKFSGHHLGNRVTLQLYANSEVELSCAPRSDRAAQDITLTAFLLMAFLDKFNDWYVRSVPETGSGPSVSWMEPVAGSRYRWKAARITHLLIMVGIFLFMLLPLPGKHRPEPMPMQARLVLASALTALIALVSWGGSYASTRIILTAQIVYIGTGRSMRRLPLDTAREARWEEQEGYRVLVVTEKSGKQERIYLSPNQESEVFELLTKAGWLKSL